MFYIIAYDISNNNKRTRLAKRLERHGLSRFQFSVFIGYLPERRYQLLETWTKNSLSLEVTDKVAFIPILERELENMVIFGTSKVDIDYLLHRVHTYVL